LGFAAGYYNVTGQNNTYLGTNAGKGASGESNSNNTAVGKSALEAVTTGSENVIVGGPCGDSITDGHQNVAIGSNAFNNTSTVGFATVVGFQAGNGALDADADGTVAIGAYALTALTSGDQNTAVGYQALLICATGTNNTALGHATLDAATSDGNTAVGSTAGGAVSDGTHNVFVGYASGNHNINVSTGDFNTVIGSLADTSDADAQGQIAIGYDVSCIANSTVTIGQGGNKASLGLDGSDTSWAAASSDERYKENIETSTAGLSFVNDLRPITYNWKKEKDVPSDMPAYKEGSDEPVLGYEYGETLHGFIAQEVKVTIDEHIEIKEGFKMWKEYDNGVQTVADGNLIPMLVKAVQELSAKVEALEDAQ